MYPLFRLIKVSAAGVAGKSLGPLDTSRIRFMVWPNDIDTNWHMNNGRYLTLMDLGRWDLALRTGLVRAAVKNHWRPLAGGVAIRFRRPLPPFRPYEMTTRVLCWDHKWFYSEQCFRQDGRAKARALVRLLFKGRGGNVPPSEVVGALGHTGDSPELPAEVLRWREMVEASRG
jgi:acyl-CoA thioesterase FadM